MSLKSSLILAVCAFLVNVPVAPSWQCNDCDVIYKAKGCYRDYPSRVLKTQVINERDPSSNVFDGHRVEWTNWNNYMVEFACRCAKAVKEKGWKIFGLQDYGECWSGAPNTYDESNFVSSDSCIGEDYEPCGGLDRHCVGPQWTNYVFDLVDDCDVQFERVGCFRDNEIAPRPLPELMMTDRVKNLPVSSGQNINWSNWDSYMPEFVCRCAKKAKEKGYTTFGVQYYGECWSGPNGDETYGKLGPSTNCVDECYAPCHSDEPFCSGKQSANAVYTLTPDKRSRDEEAKVVGRNDDEEPLFDVLAKTAANPQKRYRVKEKKSTGRKFKRFP